MWDLECQNGFIYAHGYVTPKWADGCARVKAVTNEKTFYSSEACGFGKKEFWFKGTGNLMDIYYQERSIFGHY